MQTSKAVTLSFCSFYLLHVDLGVIAMVSRNFDAAK